MSITNENCLMLFVKYPLPGHVKTRLGKEIGHTLAAAVYKNFVRDIMDTLTDFNAALRIFFYPARAKQRFKEWLGGRYCYIAQAPGSLGQKMRSAFKYTFNEHFNNVVIIGSDSPDLPGEYLKLSFDALTSNEAVIGPSSDGGFYLLGFSKESFQPQIFENVSWGTAEVFEQVVKILRRNGKKIYQLPQWHDVDNFSDLKSLIQRNTDTNFNKSRTFCHLMAEFSKDRLNVRL